MTAPGVHPYEMPESDPLADPALASFLDDLEVVASRPVPAPRPALAAILADGISPEPTVPASTPRPARRATPRRKMIVSELLAGILAKLAGLGLAAKAGLGLTMAAASVTTAGVANVLPDPAQHAVATAVGAATPFSLPDPSDTVEGAADDVGDDLPEIPGVTTTTLADEGDDEGDDEATRPANHGACVSAIARDKSAQVDGSHGKAVSEAARSDCGKDGAGSTTTTVPGDTTSTTVTSTTTTSTPELGTSSHGGPGNGNGNAGQGGGNSGPGNGNGNGGGNPGRR